MSDYPPSQQKADAELVRSRPSIANKYDAAARRLAELKLAEADEGPVTLDRLSALGWKIDPPGELRAAIATKHLYDDGGQSVCLQWNSETGDAWIWSESTHDCCSIAVKRPETMADIRRLLAALEGT